MPLTPPFSRFRSEIPRAPIFFRTGDGVFVVCEPTPARSLGPSSTAYVSGNRSSIRNFRRDRRPGMDER